ncbi:ABC transporter ATP-binding protein [Asticcacaulis solisilvae]|uniref:ABC transporter ATP-binding protein n=1 Tax=Asticcacaulis solisilvae TaxID=1217274 RepID=UPI003FD7D17D
MIRRLLGLMGAPRLKCGGAIGVCLALEGIGIVLAILGPYALKVLVDHLGRGDTSTPALLAYAGLFVVAWTATTILGPVRNAYSSKINTRLVRELSVGALAGNLGEGLWRKTDSGRVQGLLERLPYSLAIVVDGLIWRTAPLAVQLVFSLAVIVQIMSWTYVAGFAGLAIGFVAVSWLGISRQIAVSRAYNERLAASGELLGDILKNARRVVANGATGYELAGVGASFDGRERSEASMNGSLIRQSALQWLVMATALFAIMIMAGLDVLHGRITAGDFVLVQAYAIRLIMPLSTVAFVLSQSAGALAAVGDILDMQGTPPKALASDPTDRRPASIRLEGVSFSYGRGLAGVSDITLEFPAASFTAIVGANGSGKSTLAQLIAGLLTPDDGSIWIGTRTLAEAQAESGLAKKVLYVPQRTSLFNRDLRANLLYPPCDHDEAAALDILRSWGFQDGGRPIDPGLKVGEGGSALSGGQAQKLELARLLGVRKPCLVLDESTSALDPQSETRVIVDLRRGLGIGTTLILVTHRLAVAQDADQVVWMQDGHVAGVGGHHELMAHPEYKLLWAVRESDATSALWHGDHHGGRGFGVERSEPGTSH